MVYEMAVVAKADAGEEALENVRNLVRTTVGSYDGGVLIEDDWGVKTLAQPTSNGVARGNYLFFLFTAKTTVVPELERLLAINETVLKRIIVKAANSDDQAQDLAKNFKTPLSKKYAGSVVDNLTSESESDGKRFTRRKTCWFTSNKIKADWKDPKTFIWMLNEFGKISPARMTATTRVNQNLARSAINRARQVGIASNLTNRIAQ